MDPELTAFKTMFDYKLEPEVYNFHLLDALIKAAEKEGITNFPIHVKLDTGMHRLGFAVEDIPLLIRRLKNQSAVIPRSVFSHFVGSDSSQFDAFADRLNCLRKVRKNCRPPSLIKFSVISVIRQESSVFPKHSTIWCAWESDFMESAR